MTILKGKETFLTTKLTESERNLGVDLKLTDDHDLEINNFGDMSTISGFENAAQAAYLKLNIEPGGLIYHPTLGAGIQIGEKTKDAFEVKTNVIRSLNQDDRFANINAKVEVIGNLLIISIRLTVKGTDLEVPLQFAVAV